MDQRRLPPDLPALLRKREAEKAASGQAQIHPQERTERLAAEKAAREEDEELKATGRSPGAIEERHRQMEPTVANGANRNLRQRGQGTTYRRAPRLCATLAMAAIVATAGSAADGPETTKGSEPRWNGTTRPSCGRGIWALRSTSPHSQPTRRGRGRQPNKFNFDWDPDDDTSRPFDPIYADRPDPLFKLAGFDNTDELVLRKADAIRRGDRETERSGQGQLLEQHQRVKQAAERKNLGKHWSEKKLEDMKERDWRIFKENFGMRHQGRRHSGSHAELGGVRTAAPPARNRRPGRIR